ncbi:MAG: TolC family protein [Candidatus Omnitrophica bacterium]|nr:TolC family protein [Candidatus Omnitrophota bacterium]
MADASDAASPYVLSDLQYETDDNFSRIVFSANNGIGFTHYELQEPYRIVVDLLGVSFCELQEHVEYDQGLVRSIDIVETPYAQKPQGLDEYFYAVDYIIITPREKLPYSVDSFDHGKVIAVDIGAGLPAGADIAVPLTQQEDARIITENMPSEKAPGYAQFLPKSPLPVSADYGQEPEVTGNLLDVINVEDADGSILIILSTMNTALFEVQKVSGPDYSIMVTPKAPVFTKIEGLLKFNSGPIRSIRIIKDNSIPLPESLDKSYYPIKYIALNVDDGLVLSAYSNDDDTVLILELFAPVDDTALYEAGSQSQRPQDMADKPEEVVVEQRRTEADFTPAGTSEIGAAGKTTQAQPEAAVRTEQEQLKDLARKEFLTMFRDEIREESLIKQKNIDELKKAELESRKRQAYEKAQSIGKEVLKELFVDGKGTLSLGQSRLIALENNSQAKTAKEEIKLSLLKKRDAFRALFPNVKLQASHTVGDVYGDQGFTEEVYGVGAEHPLYQGGRLMNAYKQSKVNVDLAQAKYKKIEHEVNFKVAEAYLNIVSAIMNLRLQQQLLKDAEPVLKLAQKRHDAGLSTDLEMLNVQTRYNQIQFQIATAERDLALGRFKLQQAMGLDMSDKAVDIGEVDLELPFKVIDIDLYECLDISAKNYPDILVNKLIVESNEYGEKITKGKEGFRVDLTGFYGAADSYYNTESKNLEPDWNIGVKVSKPFWFATPSYSFTKEKTSRKVGQTDRTGTTANAGEISILDKDSLSLKSEIEESRISKQKSENDLIETRRQSALSVKEAYYSYQEAVLQVKNALEKVNFHEEAVKAARAQAELNEAMQSQLLDSLIQLADEKSVYIKAVSDYNLAVVKLNNAIGISDYFKAE